MSESIKDVFDENYFLRGVECGTSCYQNYSWHPDLTIPMSYFILKYLGVRDTETIGELGTARGYFVKACRLFGFQAFGWDISEWAVNSADNETRKYLKISTEDNTVPFNMEFDYVIAKDVFEHIPENCIDKVLRDLSKSGKNLFAIIPLGKNDKYIIPAYSLDVTHVLAKDKDWWITKFEKNGWKLKEFSFYVGGIKESWKNFEEGNGFFLLMRN